MPDTTNYRISFGHWLLDNGHDWHGDIYVADDGELFTWCRVHRHTLVTQEHGTTGGFLVLDELGGAKGLTFDQWVGEAPIPRVASLNTRGGVEVEA